MALKDVLVHIDNSDQCAVRLQVAIELTTAHGGHLTGLYVVPQPHIPAYIEAQLTAEIIDIESKYLAERTAAAEQAFRHEVDKAGVANEWRTATGGPVDALTTHGRYADITIVGQYNPGDGELAANSEMVDNLILTVGRPVLVVPYIGKHPTFGETILVAWDASRLATRAVNDALPFLQAAKKVIVMAVNPEGGPAGHGDVPGADICLHLARHDVVAEALQTHAKDIDIGDILLSRASDLGVDLMVMGAYGHRRLRELVLGGATRHILGHMTVPVLMSH
jgi:nucleotide-binding universal stress UspA family protein